MNFFACFWGNGRWTYSPFGRIILIIYVDEEIVVSCNDCMSRPFGESFFGDFIKSDDKEEYVVDISWQLDEWPQGLNKGRFSYWAKYGRIQDVVSDVINRCKSSLLMCEEENLLDVDLSAYGK